MNKYKKGETFCFVEFARCIVKEGVYPYVICHNEGNARGGG